MKNLPTLRNDSSFVVQFNNSIVSKTRAILLFTIKIVEILNATHSIRLISNDNPAKISPNFT